MRKTFQTVCLATVGFSLVAHSLPLEAQSPTEAPTTAVAPEVAKLSHAELDTLLAPIALYPDPLLAQILPAATAPGDIVMAARYVAAKKDIAQVDSQPWEESVKALVHYPSVLKMMDEKLDWTTHLGEVFIAQPTDVFNTVQRLRAQAHQVGNLKETPQQVVVVEKEVIKIMPADPQVVYVPQYPPEAVYVQQPVDVVTPLVTFGVGLALGAWIHNEVDWHNNDVYYHNNGWNGAQVGHHGSGGSYYGGGSGNGNTINRGGNTVNRGGNTVNVEGDVNIGRGNGNSGSVWKPQTKPRPTPYGGANGNQVANRPGTVNNGNNRGGSGTQSSQLPANNRGGTANQLPAGNRAGTGGTKPSQQPARDANRGSASAREKAQPRPSTTEGRTRTTDRQSGLNQFEREGTKPRSSTSNRTERERGNRGDRGGGGGPGRR